MDSLFCTISDHNMYLITQGTKAHTLCFGTGEFYKTSGSKILAPKANVKSKLKQLTKHVIYMFPPADMGNSYAQHRYLCINTQSQGKTRALKYFE